MQDPGIRAEEGKGLMLVWDATSVGRGVTSQEIVMKFGDKDRETMRKVTGIVAAHWPVTLTVLRGCSKQEIPVKIWELKVFLNDSSVIMSSLKCAYRYTLNETLNRLLFQIAFFWLNTIVMPPTRRSWRGIILASGRVSFHPFVKNRACWDFEILYMDSSWKNSWRVYFFLSELFPFLELCPFEKIGMKSDACHILGTVHARVLKLHIRNPHGKIADQYFFLVWVIFLSGVMPFEKIRMKYCQHDISKSI